VRGTVHALSAGDTAAGFVEPGGILKSEGMEVLVTVERVEVTPPRRVTKGPDTVGTTVTAVLRDPQAFDGRLVEVSGRAWPSARGFVLSADGRDIFVSSRHGSWSRFPTASASGSRPRCSA
jgi:hypothetical protein